MTDPNHDIVPTLRMFDGVMMGKAADEIESLRVQVAELKKDNDAYKEANKISKDAARYQWLREQHWSGGVIAVVLEPKRTVKLGAVCPSGVQLDRIIDNGIGV